MHGNDDVDRRRDPSGPHEDGSAGGEDPKRDERAARNEGATRNDGPKRDDGAGLQDPVSAAALREAADAGAISGRAITREPQDLAPGDTLGDSGAATEAVEDEQPD